MVMCFVYGCNHRSDRSHHANVQHCQFRRFPRDTEMFKKWKDVIRREDTVPNKYSRVCKCHFETQDSSIPSIFPWNINKRFDFKSPEKKIRKKNDRSFPQNAEMDTECLRTDNGIHFDAGIDAEGSGVNSRVVCTAEKDVACSNVDDGIHYLQDDESDPPGIHFDAGIDAEGSGVNSRAVCTAEKDVACSDVDDQIHCLHDDESDPPVTKRLDEINYDLKLDVDKLENENEDLWTRILAFASVQDEFERLRNDYNGLAEINSNLKLDMEKLKNENEDLKAQIRAFATVQDELQDVKKKYEDSTRQNFVTSIMQNDELFEHYTGITHKSFDIIQALLCGVECDKRVVKLSEEHQLLLTLIKLRQNPTHIDLGLRFGICKATVSKILHIYITKLHHIIFKIPMATVPSRFKNALSLPKAFDTFSNCRMIIDCTEVPCDIPGEMDEQKLTYSAYKSRNTFKVLLGCAPNGTSTFCSELYPGSFSDRVITEHCGVLDVFEAGDLILADKGFNISDLLPEGVVLNTPPFKNAPQFSDHEIYQTTRTAQARIHIERVINRLKKFRITRHISASLFGYANEIVQVCVALINFQPPLIKSVERSMSLVQNPRCSDTDVEDADDLIQNLSISDPNDQS